ncbi:MAG: Asp23/Gls24 family envelope stress response protein [Sciscionella sp.]
MAVNNTTEVYVLPCERLLDDVVAAMEAGHPPDAHERTCRHCRTAREGLRSLWEATALLNAAPVEPPAGLTERIMQAVRAEVRRPGMLPLREGTYRVEVSEQAIAVILRYAADGVAGVRARHCAVRLAGYDEHGTAELHVELSLALRYGTAPAEQTLGAIRERVTRAADDRIGVRITRCDLLVEDVYSS